MAQHRLWARRGFYRRGRLRKLAHGRGGAVLEQEFLLRVGLSLGASQVRSEDKMATDLQMVTLLFYQKTCHLVPAFWLKRYAISESQFSYLQDGISD
jgi:hypothetical protein